MAESTSQDPALAGTARLWVVVPGVAVSVFFGVLLDYCLPLYFGALNQAAQAEGGSFPPDAWSVLWKYQQAVWMIGPFLAGLLARRYGEKLVWGAALVGQAAIPLVLLIDSSPATMRPLAVWLGVTGSVAWIAGISLVQAVAPKQKGLANGLLMTTVGVGSLCAPLVGRLLLYRQELAGLAGAGEWAAAGNRFLNLAPMTAAPAVGDFATIFWLLAVSSVLGGLAIGRWGQRSGSFGQQAAADWGQTVTDLGRLARSPTFWALVLSLCVLGGPVFAMANQFLPYRADDLGLKSQADDRGWLWLQVLKPLMWIPGGAAVGWLAGRRAPGIAGVVMLAAFSLTALGIGASETTWQLFFWVALFEFTRQFMRWSNGGYLSEHLPADLRATAIGCSITLAGLGGTIASWGADHLWSPAGKGFQSSRPFFAAACCGLTGSLLLFVWDRIRPIRDPRPSAESRIEDRRSRIEDRPSRGLVQGRHLRFSILDSRSSIENERGGAMKITAVEPLVVHAGVCNWVFARLSTDQGISGLGEGTLLGKARTVAAGIEDVAGYLIGQDPRNPERIWRRIYESDRYRGGPILTSVLSAIDMACWDILGKHLSVPVWQLLGGACRDRIRLYGRLSTPGDAEQEQAGNVGLVHSGYTAIKLGVRLPPTRVVDESALVRESVLDFARVRQAVGPEVDLLFDTHAMLSLAAVTELAKGLEPYGPYFLEEPLAPEDVAGLGQLRRQTGVPLASGERLLTKYGFRDLIDGRLVDHVQPDVCHAGGLTELKKIAALAEAKHVLVSPHNPSSHSELATIASLHLDASIPNFGLQEHPAQFPPWRYELFHETIAIRDGYALLPDRPGLGLTLREEVARAHPYRPYTRVTLLREDGCPTAT